jgi:hypothetical protein
MSKLAALADDTGTAREIIDALLDDLADRVAARISLSSRAPVTPAWLDTREAAAHLSISVNALHKLTQARQIEFSQETEGAKCWFKREWLDAYREQFARPPLRDIGGGW